MSRSFYAYAIFFLIVSVSTGIVHAFASWALSEQILELPSIVQWYITLSITGIIAWIFIPVYYYHKGFRFAFFSSLAFLLADLTAVITFYHVIQTHEITPVFAVATFLTILSQLVMSVSLLFSNASQQRWLKRTGVVLAISSLLSLTISIAALVSIEVRMTGLLELIDRAINIISLLAPVFLAVSFFNEYQMAQKNSEKQEFVGLGLTFVALSLVGASCYYGALITHETRYRLSHPEEVAGFIKEAAFPFMPKTYVSKRGDTLRYRLMIPKRYYDSSHLRYPIVVCLHGSTGAGSDNAKQIVTCLPAQILSSDEMREKYPAFLLVPQAPRGSSFGGFSSLPGVDSLVIEAMHDIEATLPVDTSRRYVTGYSMGGFGAWNMIGKWPELFAAAVPMCGKGDVDIVERIKDKPIWAFHGAQDINVPVSGSRDMIEAIRKAGGNPIYTEFPGRAHDITKEIREMPEWVGWMFDQRIEVK